MKIWVEIECGNVAMEYRNNFKSISSCQKLKPKNKKREPHLESAVEWRDGASCDESSSGEASRRLASSSDDEAAASLNMSSPPLFQKWNEKYNKVRFKIGFISFVSGPKWNQSNLTRKIGIKWHRNRSIALKKLKTISTKINNVM